MINITLQREALLKPLQAITSVVEKKQTSPILSNVLLSIKDNQLCLTGTDLEIELIGYIKTEQFDTLSPLTVSARKLFDYCRTLPESSLLSLALEKKHLVVRALGSYFMLNTLPAEDFPSLEDIHYPIQFSIKQSHFKNLLSKTYFAMGQQDVRQYLNGAFFDIRPNMIKCVAADGHRLALTTIQDEQIGDVTAKIILPRKSVLELIRLFGNDNEQNVKVYISDNRFRIITEDFIFTSKLINAQYPDYNRLIPPGKMMAIAETEAIKQALTRAAILSNEKFRGVRFQLTPDKLCITANNSDQEQAEEALSLQYEGHPIEISFNVAYLLDVVSAMLSATKSKEMRFSFTDSNNGVLIEATEGDNSLYVVMPMRL